MGDQQASVFQRIWIPFFILFALTALEFLIAFTMPANGFRIGIFIFLTLLKAFYIVAYFMHLKFERLNLIYTIALPILFVALLLFILMYEANYMPGF